MIIQEKIYIRGSKDSNFDFIQEIQEKYEIEISEEVQYKLKYIGYEIECLYEINTDTGEVKFLSAKET